MDEHKDGLDQIKEPRLRRVCEGVYAKLPMKQPYIKHAWKELLTDLLADAEEEPQGSPIHLLESAEAMDAVADFLLQRVIMLALRREVDVGKTRLATAKDAVISAIQRYEDVDPALDWAVCIERLSLTLKPQDLPPTVLDAASRMLAMGERALKRIAAGKLPDGWEELKISDQFFRDFAQVLIHATPSTREFITALLSGAVDPASLSQAENLPEVLHFIARLKESETDAHAHGDSLRSTLATYCSDIRGILYDPHKAETVAADETRQIFLRDIAKMVLSDDFSPSIRGLLERGLADAKWAAQFAATENLQGSLRQALTILGMRAKSAGSDRNGRKRA